MGVDAASRIGVPETEKDLHQGTDPPPFRSGQADHSPNRRVWIRECGHSQSVRRIWGSQAGQFLLPEVLFSRTELRHLWSGAIGHPGNTKTVATLPRGRQSQSFNSAWPQQSRILPDIRSTLQKTSQVVGSSFRLRLCHWAPGRQQEPGRWPILTARLRDRLPQACGTTLGNGLSGTIQWSHASHHRGPGFRPLGCRRLGKACRPTNDRRPKYRQRGEPMESRRGSLDLRGEDIRSSGRFSTRKSDKSIPWQSWVRSFRSSWDYWAGIQGFLLASNGLACT